MNLTGLLNFESVHSDGELKETEELYLLVTNSLKALIEEFFVEMAPSFILVVSCRRKSPLYFAKNVLQLLFSTMLNINVQLVYMDSKNPQRIFVRRPHNILLVDSFEAFLDIDVMSYSRNYGVTEFYHILLLQRDQYVFENMRSIYSYCWNNNIINCNIQYQSAKGDIFLYTYFPFTYNRCNSNEPQHIDTFIDNSWINKTYFQRKLTNFYGCPLVAVARDIPPYSYITKAAHDTVSFSGFEIDMFKYLAEKLNFTLDLRTRTVDDRSFPLDNGALKMVVEGTADVAFGFYRKHPGESNNYSTTFPHYQSNVVAIIYLPAHSLNTFEVLLFPFDDHVWYAVFLSMVIVLVITWLIRKHRTQSIKIFSMISCGLGVPIQEQPKQPHSVLLFLTWLWSSFLIRIIYSGLLFRLIRYKVFSFLPNTLKQAVDKNFHAVMIQFMYNKIKNIPTFENSENQTSVVLPSENELEALFYIEQSNIKDLYAVTNYELFIDFMRKYSKRGLFYVIPEIIVQQQLCIYTVKNSYLISQLEWEIMFLRSSGLFRYWSEKYINYNYFIEDELYQDALFMQDDLWSIYVVCCVIYFIAFLIFLIEILSVRVRVLARLFK